MRQISYIDDFLAWKEEFRFSVDIPIRFSETDMFGHVNNVSPFIYFEHARIEFLKWIDLFPSIFESDTIPIVADLQCDYLEQIFFGETIKVYVKIAHIGNSSLDIHYMAMKEEGTICLTGRGRLVNVDRKTGKSVPFSSSQKEKLLQVSY